MNYKHIYDALIVRAQLRQNVNGYAERHHVLPKSIGGSNKKSNLVLLTAREHYIAHRLLVKIYKHSTDGQAYKKMVYAMWFLSKTIVELRFVSSRAYETARVLFSKENPNKDAKRKQQFLKKHKAGLYKYDYVKVSNTLKATLNSLTLEEMKTRMAPAHRCDQRARGDAIKRGKCSQLKMTTPDGNSVVFYSYDDIRSITGSSYDVVKLTIRKRKGFLKNGNYVEYIKKYEGKNRWNTKNKT
jgi:hypothetical protein